MEANPPRAKRVKLAAFVALCIAQLYIAASSIGQHEQTLQTGSLHRFAAEPYDPQDPFRGRYLRLRFPAERVALPLPEQARPPIYAVLQRGARGLSVVSQLRTERPEEREGVDYLTIDRFDRRWEPGQEPGQDRPRAVDLTFPFRRYFLEESLAPRAERIYRERSGTDDDEYLTVRVNAGRAVPVQLFVDGQPIERLARDDPQPDH